MSTGYWPSSATLRLAQVVCCVNVGSHFMLYLDGVVDNLLPAAHSFLLKHYGNEREASKNWELMVSLRMYGLALGCILSTILDKRMGRKPQVLIGMILNIAGVLLTLIIVYVPGGLMAAHIGRFINGCGQGIVQTAGTVMLLELPPRRCRGTVLATMTVFACMGELLSMVLSLSEVFGNARRWHLAMAFPVVLLVPAFLVLLRAPESPRYLFNEGSHALALQSLDYYQSPADAHKSLAEMGVEQSHDECDVNSNTPLLKRRDSDDMNVVITRTPGEKLLEGRFLRPLFVGVVLNSFVHLDDWLWISYSTYIFEKHGFGVSAAQKASLVMSLPQSVLSLMLVSVFEKFPRKTLLVYPTLVSACLGAISIITLRVTPNTHQHLSLSSCLLPFLASLDLCMAGIAGESAFTVVPELFLYQHRIIGTAICGVAQSLFGGVLLNFLLTSLDRWGAQLVLIPFVCGNLLYALFNAVYVPETAMKSPQEVADALERTFTRRQRLTTLCRSLSQRSPKALIYQIGSFVGQIILCFVAVNAVVFGVSLIYPRASSMVIVPDRHILRASDALKSAHVH